ncbi:MAG: tripartite tricarboxylate transporter substrate binding protein [Burkholderiales bacterium]|nr:tripartite tricarboxylate transporter substrate binding protein [Burkholderiales bacterium]
MTTSRIIRWLAAVALTAAHVGAFAQDFPTRPVTLVAPFPAGSVTDSVSRALAQAMQESLGQPVVVDNKAGAQGTIGAAFVANSKPDGYTLLVGSSVMFVAKSLFKTLPYEPVDGFQPVAGIGSTSMMFMVKDSSAYKSIADVTNAARSGREPVTIAYGSPSGQVALALFSNAAGVKPVGVSYKGIPQALTDLAGGHVSVAIVDIGSGVTQMKSGGMRALAISAQARSTAAPDVPTLAESLRGAEISLETIIAIMAPAKTPPAVVERLEKAIRAALAKPEMRTRLAGVSITPLPITAIEVTQRLKTDNPRWEGLIKAAGIEPQ